MPSELPNAARLCSTKWWGNHQMDRILLNFSKNCEQQDRLGRKQKVACSAAALAEGVALRDRRPPDCPTRWVGTESLERVLAVLGQRASAGDTPMPEDRESSTVNARKFFLSSAGGGDSAVDG